MEESLPDILAIAVRSMKIREIWDRLNGTMKKEINKEDFELDLSRVAKLGQ